MALGVSAAYSIEIFAAASLAASRVSADYECDDLAVMPDLRPAQRNDRGSKMAAVREYFHRLQNVRVFVRQDVKHAGNGARGV